MDIVRYIAEHFLVVKSGTKAEKLYNKDRAAGDDFKAEYKLILKTKKSTKPSFYEAIDIVHRAGGKAIIAHPGLSKGYKDGMVKEWELPESEWYKEYTSEFTPFKFIKDLKEHGLDGIELYHYAGSDKQHAKQEKKINQYFTGLANKLGLETTRGSDCHGPKGKGPLMGKFGSKEIVLKDLVDRYQTKQR
jgi:hypothetical protein